MDKRLACCILADRCMAMTNACTREALSTCGMLADYRKSRLPVPFCVSSTGCAYQDQCTSESLEKFGCAAVNKARIKGMSVTDILLAEFKKNEAYPVEGPWFEALKRISSDGQFEIAQRAVEMNLVRKKFGVRFSRTSGDPSLDPSVFGRLDQV